MDREDRGKANGSVPNGLRSSEAASVTKVLDPERLAVAEGRTKELITLIQPNKPSEERRIAIANYVQKLIVKCFPCEVFTFGSVPLKTFLPDGDIDLTAFSDNLDLKDTWANDVREVLENEGKSENAEFHVKEVQYIKAEVKIIKCLVENIVVDISFNQLGGLCTLCFLEEIDNVISQDHLFKRSIILIKAWCYYESRILGAHHGLLSTYALEALVLYIFHVFNSSFGGPLEVLYRFLEFFSRFDWENFCVSLWGPVPISSLPDTTAEPPRKDSGDSSLSRMFLAACRNYAVFPLGQDTQVQSFVSKHFNVIDPLRTTNNLGRSVSKGNFFRIRCAFTFGAKKLAELLECPKEDLVAEFDKFFTNTWRRHGNGNRPDAPAPIPLQPRSLHSENSNQDLDVCKNKAYTRKKTENAGSRQLYSSTDVSGPCHDVSSQPVITNNQIPENISSAIRPSGFQSQKSYGHETRYGIADQNARSISSSDTVQPDKYRPNLKPGYFSNDYTRQGKLQFARTHSSPELSDTSAEILPHARRNNTSEIEKNKFISGKPNTGIRKNFGPKVHCGQDARLINESTSPRYHSSHSHVSSVDSNNLPNNFHDSVSFSSTGEDVVSIPQVQGVNQKEEQDLASMMASLRVNGLGQLIPLPVNFSSHQFPVPPNILPQMVYSNKNIGVIPANVPIVPWAQFPQGFMSPPSTSSYFSNAQADNSEEMVESGNVDPSLAELNQDDPDQRFWSEQEPVPSVAYVPHERNFQIYSSDEKKVHPFGRLKSIPFPQVSDHNLPFTREHARIARESINMERGSQSDANMHRNTIESDMHSTTRLTNARFSHASHASSSRNMVADTWDSPSTKTCKLPKDRHGTEPISSAASSNPHGINKSWWLYENPSVGHGQVSRDEDNSEWANQSSLGNEIAEPNTDSLSPVSGNQESSSSEPAVMSGSDSMFSMFFYAPQQRQGSSPGPYAQFFHTGGVFPCLMVPMCKFSSDSEASDGSLEHFNGVAANQSNLSVRKNEASVSTNILEDDSDSTEEHKSDILNSDFCSHLHNLHYGRLCQGTDVVGPSVYPAPFLVPPVYFQGHHPWDGPGRPFPANANLVPLMNYGPRLLPVMPRQPSAVRHGEVYQHYGEELPSFRGGTGTFLPKAKVPFRDRPSNSRNHRTGYTYDRSSRGDREGSWISSKSRALNRNHGRVHHDKPSARVDRLSAMDNRSERSWDSYRSERVVSNHQNNAVSSTSSSTPDPASLAYDSECSMSSDGLIHQSGAPVQSFVMLYPYNHPNLRYGSPSETVEFGSLGPMHLSGVREAQASANGVVPRSAFEPRHEANHQQGSECSSPDQPSSPRIRRSPAWRNYRLKEEDFPPL